MPKNIEVNFVFHTLTISLFMVYMVSQNSNQWKYKYRLSSPKAGHIPHHNSWCSSIHETHVCVGAAWEVNHRKNGWTNERTVSVFYSPFVAVFRMKTHCWIDETTQNEKREMLFFNGRHDRHYGTRNLSHRYRWGAPPAFCYVHPGSHWIPVVQEYENKAE